MPARNQRLEVKPLHPQTFAMRHSSCFTVGVLAFGFSLGSLCGQTTRPIELEDLFRLKRVGDPQIAPDGKHVAYVVTEVLKDENRTNSDVWLIGTGENGATQGEPRKLTNSPKHDRHPRWSPDGKWIAFESTRDGTPQIFLLAIDGGEARKLTTLSSGAGQPMWAPDGKSLAFVSAVFPEFSDKPFKESDKLNQEKQDAREKSKVKARVIDKLLYRHWDEWVADKRQHVFVVKVKPDGSADGDPRDVTPGENDAVPTSSTFSAGDEFAFSPDGKEIAFCAPPFPIREQAWRTNHDVWTVNFASGERKNLTAQNLGADGYPRYSPDGKFVAYRAQARAGFEADKWDLWLLDRATGQRRILTANWPGSVDNIVWSPDSQTIFLEGQEKGRGPVWSVSVSGGEVKRLFNDGVNHEVSVSPNGRWLAFTQNRLNRPAEIGCYQVGESSTRALSLVNGELLGKLKINAPESVTVSGAGGTPLQMWILKPPGFDAAKKYPLVFWVHGGPQSAFLDSWSTRWNAQLWAAQGYVIALPNPRGSTGFGQKFTDEISHDWGGKVFDDLMACLAHLEKQPYIDTAKMASAGASYGGYMMNWFQGHTDKFKTLVTHCGVYDFVSMYGTTEEVWFDEWDHGIPWENPEFEKWSPHKHAAKFKTPNLIIHNELDFRVPVNQGLSLFTTLQRKGVPSKLLYFPDEGHWVLKPQNSELWHKTVFEWLEGYLKK
ncbi:MAG: S9 family peptidase [Opitutus sp.]|nr:S9 family peptidase [Opitutus sp.]